MEHRTAMGSEQEPFALQHAVHTAWRAADLRVRRFATHRDDLDVAFEQTPRPVLMTRLLASCLSDNDGAPLVSATITRWNVNQRLHALQAVAAASGIRELSLQARCPNGECGETMELELDAADFSAADAVDTFTCQPDAAHTVRVRLPTGADQLAWLQADDASESALEIAMATRLVVDVNDGAVTPEWRMPPHWIDAVAAVLEQHDASAAIELQTHCPACGQVTTIAVDLEAHLLARLHAQQRELMDHVHRVASAYHWSERDIVDLGATRRRYYLSRIAADGAS